MTGRPRRACQRSAGAPGCARGTPATSPWRTGWRERACSRLVWAAMAWGASTSPSASTSAELGGDRVVDEDRRDGGGGGEGRGADHPAAGRGAIQEQRQLLAEPLGVGGAGLAGGVGEPGGKGLLVVAGVDACRVARVADLDGRCDERAQRRVDVEGGEEPFTGCEVGAVEHLGQDVGIEPA